MWQRTLWCRQAHAVGRRRVGRSRISIPGQRGAGEAARVPVRVYADRARVAVTWLPQAANRRIRRRVLGLGRLNRGPASRWRAKGAANALAASGTTAGGPGQRKERARVQANTAARQGAGQRGGGSFEGRAGRLQTKGPVIGSGHEATGRRATREQTVPVRSRGVPDDGHARALAKHTVDTEQQQERTRHPWLNSRSISFPAFPTTTAS